MKFSNTIRILLLSTPSLLVNAEKVVFKVIAINGTPSVNVNGASQAMTLDEYPVYKAEVDVPSFPVNYSYSIDGQQETVQRQRNQGEEALNEFFGRSITVKEHPELPRAFEAFEGAKESKLYDDTFVSTIIVKNADIQQLYTQFNNEDLTVPAEVTYVTPYKVRNFSAAQIGISGQSTRHVPKLSFKIKNLKDENNKELYDRSAIKLRAEHMDPSFLRDKLYGDVMNSLGVPTAQNKFARLFINGEAMGLYDLSDAISSNHYLKETFNKGEKFPEGQINPIFKADCCLSCGGYGDLGYHGVDPAAPMYAIYTYKSDDKTTVDSNAKVAEILLPLLKEIDDYKNGLRADVSLDADTFLRAMAMEYLAGGIDNYWNKPGNYYIYKDQAKNKWYFHDADFHYSFGGPGSNAQLMMTTPLAQYPPKFPDEPNQAVQLTQERPPIDAFLSHPDIKASFNNIFDRLLKTSFNPSALFPRIDSLAELIKEDAYWDFTLPKTNPQLTTNPELVDEKEVVFTNADFDNDVTSETVVNQAQGDDGVPLKYFINSRINTVAQELSLQVPATAENNLGYVTTPSAKKDKKGKDDSSAAMGRYSWSIYSAIIVLLVTLL